MTKSLYYIEVNQKVIAFSWQLLYDRIPLGVTLIITGSSPWMRQEIVWGVLVMLNRLRIYSYIARVLF
jgi:hypothetical protein